MGAISSPVRTRDEAGDHETSGDYDRSLCVLALPAAAKDSGDEAYMMRVMTCVGADANMEIYLPQTVVFKRGTPVIDNILAMPPTIGWYTLDLTGAMKGKPLEPVRINISPDKKFIIVDQYTAAIRRPAFRLAAARWILTRSGARKPSAAR